MRLLSVALVLLFVTGCSTAYQPIPASEPTALRARLDARVRERLADEAARKQAHERQVAARSEARTTYLAQHAGRPEPIRQALIAGDRIALDMTMEEVLLVVASDRVALVRRTVDERKVVESWAVTQAPVVDMTFRDGVLVTWSTSAVSAGPELAAALKRDGEPLAPIPYVPEYSAPAGWSE